MCAWAKTCRYTLNIIIEYVLYMLCCSALTDTIVYTHADHVLIVCWLCAVLALALRWPCSDRVPALR